jgi:DNA-binding response OmpR family regulator
MKILLADSDPEVLDVTTYALRRHGFDVVAVKTGEQALQCWKQTAPDLVLADLDLPGLNGLELCREIRQQAATRVIIASARYTDDEVVRGFQFGADDFVSKPFNHRQLAMRIHAIVNRTAAIGASMVRGGELQAGPLRLDLESHEVTYGTHVIRLTPIEFRLFYLLMLDAGRAVSISRLIEYAWGYHGADADALKMHISRIRQKLALRGSGTVRLESVRWVGYLLRTTAADPTEEALRSTNLP